MEEKTLKGLLWKRLELEMGLFRYATLQYGKEEIYRTSCRIAAYGQLCSLFGEFMEKMDKKTVCVLLYQEGSLLEFLYDECAARGEGIFGGLREYMADRLEAVAELYRSDGKGDSGYGTEFDQAA